MAGIPEEASVWIFTGDQLALADGVPEDAAGESEKLICSSNLEHGLYSWIVVVNS